MHHFVSFCVLNGTDATLASSTCSSLANCQLGGAGFKGVAKLAIGMTVSSSSLSDSLSVHQGGWRQKSSLRLLAGSIASTVQILCCYSLNRLDDVSSVSTGI